MAVLRSVLADDQNVEEARRVLEKRYGGADIEFVTKRDFLGSSWTEAVISV
jgi:hypothetical protein